jgi:hypothetical protein
MYARMSILILDIDPDDLFGDWEEVEYDLACAVEETLKSYGLPDKLEIRHAPPSTAGNGEYNRRHDSDAVPVLEGAAGEVPPAAQPDVRLGMEDRNGGATECMRPVVDCGGSRGGWLQRHTRRLVRELLAYTQVESD